MQCIERKTYHEDGIFTEAPSEPVTYSESEHHNNFSHPEREIAIHNEQMNYLIFRFH